MSFKWDMALAGGLAGAAQAGQQIGADYGKLQEEERKNKEYDRRMSAEMMRQESLLKLRSEYSRMDAAFGAGHGEGEGAVDAYSADLKAKKAQEDLDRMQQRKDEKGSRKLRELQIDNAEHQSKINQLMGEDPYREQRYKDGVATEEDLAAMKIPKPVYDEMVKFQRNLASGKHGLAGEVSAREQRKHINSMLSAFAKQDEFVQSQTLESWGYDPEEVTGKKRSEAFKEIAKAYSVGYLDDIQGGDLGEDGGDGGAGGEKMGVPEWRDKFQQRLDAGGDRAQLIKVLEQNFSPEEIEKNFGDLVNSTGSGSFVEPKTTGSNSAFGSGLAGAAGKDPRSKMVQPVVDEALKTLGRSDIPESVKETKLRRLVAQIARLNPEMVPPELMMYMDQGETGAPQ